MTLNRFPTRSIQVTLGFLVVAVAGLLASAAIALASSPIDAGAGPMGTFPGSIPSISCTPAPIPGAAQATPSLCTVESRVVVSAAVRRYLGLRSQTLTSGTFKGPITKNVEGQSYPGLYIQPFPASFLRVAKAKHVIGMTVSLTGTATYPLYDAFGNKTEYTQRFGDLQEVLSPASRYNGFGCPMFEGNLITAVRAGPHPCPNP